MTINLTNFKIIMMIVMTIICFAGLIPSAVPACRKSDHILSYLNCFSAGIFLAMSLIHMMPEAAEIYMLWAESLDEPLERPFPLPYVGFFIGYLLILLVDKVLAGKLQSRVENDMS